MIERLRRATRWEDLLLAGWLVLVEPLLTPADPVAAAAPSTFDGILALAGLMGLAICIGARSTPGVSTGLVANGQTAWTVGPLVGAFALVVGATVDNLGLGDTGPVIAVVLVGLALVARFRLPALDARRRRTLVTPFILVSAGAFGQSINGLLDVFNLRDLAVGAQSGDGSLGIVVFLLGLALLAILVFYVMLIYAPRQVAERQGSPGAWAVRFLLFVVSLTIGSTWLGLVRG